MILNTSNHRLAGPLHERPELSVHPVNTSGVPVSQPVGSQQVPGRTEKQMRLLLLQRSQYTNCLQCPVWRWAEKNPSTPLKNQRKLPGEGLLFWEPCVPIWGKLASDTGKAGGSTSPACLRKGGVIQQNSTACVQGELGLLMSCVAWKKLCNLSVPQFLHLYNGDSNCICLVGCVKTGIHACNTALAAMLVKSMLSGTATVILAISL